MYAMYMPMGLLAVADYVHRRGHKIEVVHAGIEEIRDRAFSLETDLLRNRPALVGLSLHWHHQAYDVIEAARAIKKAMPGVFIVLGGITAGYFQQEILQLFPFVDGVVKGDGEVAIDRLLAIKCGRSASLSSVPGLAWRDDSGRIAANAAFEGDPGERSWTNLKLLRNYELYKRYVRIPFVWLPRFNSQLNSLILDRWSCFPLPVARGCDVNCSFCGGGSRAGTKAAGRGRQVLLSQNQVVRAAEEVKEYGYDRIFIDISPRGDPGYFEELFRQMRARGLKIGCMAGLDTLPSGDFLRDFAGTFELRKSRILLSPETESEELRKLHKGRYFSNKELIETVALSASAGIHTELFFMLGLPFQTASSLKSMRAFQDMFREKFGKMISVRTDFVTLEPGAPMYNDPGKYGMVKEWNSFMDYYHAHSGEHGAAFPPRGFYLNNFGGGIFEKQIEEIYCREFCRMREFLTPGFLKGRGNMLAQKLISRVSRFACRTAEYCQERAFTRRERRCRD